MNRRTFVSSTLAVPLSGPALAASGSQSPGSSHAPRVLVVGLDPRKLPAGQPALDPALTPAAIVEGVRRDQGRMAELGFDVVECMDGPNLIEPAMRAILAAGSFDVVVIGAGLRLNPAHFLLFERVVNLAHELAPGARIAFNTRPDDSTEAILRWLPASS